MVRDTGIDWRLTQRACADTELCSTDNWPRPGNVYPGTQASIPADIMALYQNFTVNSDGQPFCTYDECDLSDTSRWEVFLKSLKKFYLGMAFLLFSYVEDFAAGNDYFVEELAKVYIKVLSNGYDNLETIAWLQHL